LYLPQRICCCVCATVCAVLYICNCFCHCISTAVYPPLCIHPCECVSWPGTVYLAPYLLLSICYCIYICYCISSAVYLQLCLLYCWEWPEGILGPVIL
jgi:hypothetical protein